MDRSIIGNASLGYTTEKNGRHGLSGGASFCILFVLGIRHSYWSTILYNCIGQFWNDSFDGCNGPVLEFWPSEHDT